jgi:hypothetical protein
VQRVAALAEVKDTFTKAGGRPLPLNADEARALLARDLERWTRLVRAAGLAVAQQALRHSDSRLTADTYGQCTAIQGVGLASLPERERTDLIARLNRPESWDL